MADPGGCGCLDERRGMGRVQARKSVVQVETAALGSGTAGGDLLQRPRCWYYRDETIVCIKKGGGRCYASDPEGENKYNAILGGGPSFIVHPSDCAPALVALNASVTISGPKGNREMPLQSFFTLPRCRLMLPRCTCGTWNASIAFST